MKLIGRKPRVDGPSIIPTTDRQKSDSDNCLVDDGHVIPTEDTSNEEATYEAPIEVISITCIFKKGMETLYRKMSKKKFNMAKQCLFNLNVELDLFDSHSKQKMDNDKYNSLNDLDQAFYLIDDIFDNYRLPGEIQIYEERHNTKIREHLGMIDFLNNLTWYQEILFSLGCL